MGFGYMVQPQAYSWFVKYIQILAPAKNSTVSLGKTQFLKNYNRTSKKRVQNMGRDRHYNILRRIETFLKLKPKSLTAHVYRQSAATELSNLGISLLGLKRAGRWKGIKSAEEYLEHLMPVLLDRMRSINSRCILSRRHLRAKFRAF